MEHTKFENEYLSFINDDLDKKEEQHDKGIL